MPSPHQQARQTSKLEADQYAKSLQRESLRIIVLGPGEAQPPDLRKRKQIKCRLRGRGYSRAMLGEEFLEGTEAPLHLALRSELWKIDLLLVLNTGESPLVELTTISTDLRARQITRVWWRREHADGSRSTPRDVVTMFDNWPFNREEFESCELVESMLETADRFSLSKAQLEGRLANLGLPPPS